jgi:RNA-directed DNA polymerase
VVTDFVRYADDSQIYVASRRAGERVMQSITSFIEQHLKLVVNAEKSALALARERTFLGFRFYRGRDETVKTDVAPEALRRVKERLRRLTSRTWGVSMEWRIEEINRFMVGWTAYFYIADYTMTFVRLDAWLRRRLRQIRWKEWKRPKTRYRNLRVLGITEPKARMWARSKKGYWRISRASTLHIALPNSYWQQTIGLKEFTETRQRLRER